MIVVYSLFAVLFSMFWCWIVFFFFKQKTAYEMRISDWSSDVCSSDLWPPVNGVQQPLQPNITGSDTPGLQAENRLLREQVAELREERNAWREQAQRLALTDQRAVSQPSSRPGFWSRLFGRQGDSPKIGRAHV